jgi:hypothetical protein
MQILVCIVQYIIFGRPASISNALSRVYGIAARSFFQIKFACFLFAMSFKGTVSRDGYFFECLKILISTSCVCADGF